MTYNVRTFLHRRLGGEVARVAELVAALRPDVLALQEVDVGLPRSGGLHQARELAAALGMSWHFQAALSRDGGQYGIALLSRWPMEVCRSRLLPLLPGHPRREPRGATWARIELDGRPLQVLATHLGLTASERRLQVDELLGAAWLGDPDCTPPRVLLGDLNAPPGSRSYRRLTARLPDTVARAPRRPWWRATFPSRLPLLRLDHVLASADLVVRRAVIRRGRDVRLASDHLPVLVELDWGDAA